jgi:LmbE family N-acetylglucosaminyl deacetylase
VDGGNEITNFSLSLDFEHVFNAIQGLFVGVLANFGSSNPLNVIVLLLGLFCYITLVKATIKDCKNKIPVPHSLELCHQLFGASISAVFVYLISNHNYATDARYLTICMIWVLVSIAIALSSISSSGGKFMAYLEHWNTYIKALTVFGAVCCVVGVLFGFFWQYTSYLEQKAPFTEKAERNAIIDDILSQEDVPQVLVGDYWRVADVASRNKDVVPIMVNNCSGARRGTLSTISWRNWDIDKSSFTLLLTLDDSLAGFPRCTKEDAYIKYGFPTQELLVAGTEENPNELLLVYDRDAPALPEKNTVESPFSKDIFDKNGNDCKRNLMVVMAHEDDDLIFMNPAIQHRRDEGYCIQNIYLTAGDNAKGEEYVEDRQQGEIAAHETMFDVQFDVDEIQELNQKQIRAVKTKDNHYGLYFLRLPDGGMNGEGMETHDFESLAKLERGEIDEIHDIDGNTAWTRDEIVDFIGGFAQATLSELVYSQAPRNEAGQNSIMWALIDKSVSKSHDHPDHISVGKFTRTAFLKYALANSTVKFWIGYPVQDMKPNVFGHDLKRKASIFFDYAVFDEETRCTNTSNCEKTDYEKRLDRQYEWTP